MELYPNRLEFRAGPADPKPGMQVHDTARHDHLQLHLPKLYAALGLRERVAGRVQHRVRPAETAATCLARRSCCQPVPPGRPGSTQLLAVPPPTHPPIKLCNRPCLLSRHQMLKRPVHPAGGKAYRLQLRLRPALAVQAVPQPLPASAGLFKPPAGR